MNLIICGCRTFKDYKKFKQILDIYISDIFKEKYLTIFSGMAKGVDTLAVKYAEEKGLKVRRFPANWDVYGKSAGFIRNEEMSKEADFIIAFWDGKSKGTKHMIDIAKQKKIQYLVNYV